MASGLGRASEHLAEEVLADAPMSVLIYLIAQGESPLIARVAADETLITRMGRVFGEVD